MFFAAALVICLIIKFRFPKGKAIASFIIILDKLKVKLSLNFELLVNRVANFITIHDQKQHNKNLGKSGVMKFLSGQRLINNNIVCTTCIIPYRRNNHFTE